MPELFKDLSELQRERESGLWAGAEQGLWVHENDIREFVGLPNCGCEFRIYDFGYSHMSLVQHHRPYSHEPPSGMGVHSGTVNGWPYLRYATASRGALGRFCRPEWWFWKPDLERFRKAMEHHLACASAKLLREFAGGCDG